VHGAQRHSLAVGDRPRPLHVWQDRIRDPALTVLLLVLEACLIFLAAPAAAAGLQIATPIIQTMMLVVVVIVGMLSQRRGAIAAILLGLATMLVGLTLGSKWPPIVGSILRRGGDILTFSALTWVVAHAVYAPGRITLQRLQGAVVVYLNAATIFAAAFSLIWELSPTAFASLPAAKDELGELVTMLYFSLTARWRSERSGSEPESRRSCRRVNLRRIFLVAAFRRRSPH
jgi:hypothetical protein